MVRQDKSFKKSKIKKKVRPGKAYSIILELIRAIEKIFIKSEKSDAKYIYRLLGLILILTFTLTITLILLIAFSLNPDLAKLMPIAEALKVLSSLRIIL